MINLNATSKCFLSLAIFLCSINAEGNNNRFIFEKNKPSDFSCRVENEHGILSVIIKDGVRKFDFEEPHLKTSYYFTPSVKISFNGPFISDSDLEQDSISFSLGYRHSLNGRSMEEYQNLPESYFEKKVSLKESLNFAGELYLFKGISFEINDLIKDDLFVRTDNRDLVFEISSKFTNLYFPKKNSRRGICNAFYRYNSTYLFSNDGVRDKLE